MSKISKIFSKANEEDEVLDFAGVLRDITQLASLVAAYSGESKVGKTISTVGIGVTLGSLAKSTFKVAKHLRIKNKYILKVKESDPAYVIAEEWLSEAMHDEEKLSISVDSRYQYINGKYKNVVIRQTFDGGVKHQIKLEDFDVEIRTESESGVSNSSYEPAQSSSRSSMMKTIYFETSCTEARELVIKELLIRLQKAKTGVPKKNVVSSYGEFVQASDIPVRVKESVFLKEGQLERIFQSIQTFLDSEEEYKRFGIPYHMGILMHGEPGSGKSSTAAVLAHEFGFDLYYLSLSSVKNDSDLEDLVQDVSPRSIIIYEDIDTVKASQERTNDNGGVTMGGLLNVLDGFIAPEGVVNILTTNHVKDLDPAIIRPGRISLSEYLGYIDQNQLNKMFKYYFNSDNAPKLKKNVTVSAAELIQIVRESISDLDKAKENIITFIENK